MAILVAGYLASLLLALSLLVTNDLKFRWLNLAGCAAFIVYGILINAFPIILTNTILLLINVFYLVKAYRRKENFDLVPFEPGDRIIRKFLEFYAKDIDDYFPGFVMPEDPRHIRLVVLRDMVIANLFVAELRSDGEAVVKINYTVPRYRDYRVGTFLFRREKRYLVDRGVRKIVYETVANRSHKAFLDRMAFRQAGQQMVREL